MIVQWYYAISHYCRRLLVILSLKNYICITNVFLKSIMRFTLNILVTIWVFSIINAAAFDVAAIGTLDKVEEGKYIGSKSLEYIDTDGSTKEDQVFFVYEKLTDKNLNFWENYVHQQKQGAALKDAENQEPKLLEKISEGLDPFWFSLCLCPRGFLSRGWQYLRRGDMSYDIWIAYSTRKNPRETSISNDDIEMTMSVFANKNCPFITDVGISKNYLFFFSENKPHKEMAMQLHASAGVMAQQQYGTDKSHMITRPTPLMAGIMERKLGGKSIWSPCDMAYAQRTYYINPPPHTHSRFPLDNRNPNTWKLAVSESDVRTFSRPLWFPFDGCTGGSGEHRILGNTYFSAKGTFSIFSEGSTSFGADIVAVSMKALSDIWYEPVGSR